MCVCVCTAYHSQFTMHNYIYACMSVCRCVYVWVYVCVCVGRGNWMHWVFIKLPSLLYRYKENWRMFFRWFCSIVYVFHSFGQLSWQDNFLWRIVRWTIVTNTTKFLAELDHNDIFSMSKTMPRYKGEIVVTHYCEHKHSPVYYFDISNLD